MTRALLLATVGAAVALSAAGGVAGKLVSDGQTVVFLGDSITHYGTKNPYGYVQLTVKGLSANGINVTWFGAGIPGNKALHMNQRFDKDVLARKPDLVTVSAGVNDVWFQRPDCTLDKYRVDMEAMIVRAKAAGVRVVLLTPTTAFGEGDNPQIAKYAECVRDLAAKHGIAVADTWKAVRARIDDPDAPPLAARGLKATCDGVHMAPVGDRLMARCLLRSFGLDDAEMAKAEAVWNADTSLCRLRSKIGASLAEYRALEAAADKAGAKIEDVYRRVYRKGVESLLADGSVETPSPASVPSCAPDGKKPEIAVVGDYFHFVDQGSRSGLVNFIRRSVVAAGKDCAVFAEPQFRGGTAALNGYWDEKLAGRNLAYLVVTTGSYDAWDKNRAEFPQMVRELTEKAVKSGARVVLLTTRPTRSDVSKAFNEALKTFADGKNVFVLDQLAIIRGELARRAANKSASCCAAGYPLNPNVNFLLGRALLPLIGFDKADVAKATAAAERDPAFADIEAETYVSFAEYDRLLELARREKRTLNDVCAAALVRGRLLCD